MIPTVRHCSKEVAAPRAHCCELTQAEQQDSEATLLTARLPPLLLCPVTHLPQYNRVTAARPIARPRPSHTLHGERRGGRVERNYPRSVSNERPRKRAPRGGGDVGRAVARDTRRPRVRLWDLTLAGVAQA